MSDSYNQRDWDAIDKDYSRCEEPRICNESDLVVEPWEIAEEISDYVDDMVFIVRKNNGDLQSYIAETAPSTEQGWERKDYLEFFDPDDLDDSEYAEVYGEDDSTPTPKGSD